MKRTVSLLLTLAMALTVFAGCSAKQNAAKPGVNVTTPLPGQPVSMDLSGQTFETALLKYVGAYKPDDNFAVSPLSFLFALGLLYEGCAGETRTEFEAALKSLGIDDLPGYLNKFNEFVSSVADTNKVLAEEYGQDVIKLEIANSVWKRDNIEEDFKEAYKNAIARYGAEYFGFNEGNVVRAVNEWASKKTYGLIPKLLPDDYDTADLAVILMNALYLKDSWSVEFSDANPITFTAFDGTVSQKDAIRASDSMGYYKDKDTTIVVVPLLRGLKYTVVMGSTEGLAEKKAQVESERVRLSMPAFEIESSWNDHELEHFLNEAGAKLILSGAADFSAMIDHGVSISDIIQKVKFIVNKDGIEAAAVTAVMTKDGMAGPVKYKEVVVDEPFTFFLENSDGVILFEGRFVK